MKDIPKIKRNVKRMIDGQASPEEIDKYLTIEGVTADQLRQSSEVPLEKHMDVESGAPIGVRAAVGPGYRKPEDRLSTLQRRYPGASPYGEENFVFTDPRTGRQTLYNPEGMDVGDIAEYGRMIPEMVGGAAGGVLGATGGPASLATVPAGVGLGAAAGGSIYDASMEYLGGRTDTRTLPERGLDAAVDFSVNAAGQKIGAEIPNAFNRMISGPIRNRLSGTTGRQQLGLYTKEGIPTEGAAGAITQSRAVQGVEQALAKLPTSAGRMESAANNTLQAIEGLARRTVPGQARTIEEGGSALRRGLKGFVSKFQNTASGLYTKLDDYIGQNEVVNLKNTADYLEGPIQKFQNMPNIAKDMLPAKFQGYLDDINENAGQLTWDQVKDFRTFVGKMQSDPRVISDIPTSQWKQLYGALSKDLESMAASRGNEALNAYKRANNYYSAGIKRVDVIDNLLKNPEVEKSFTAAFSGAKEGGTKLRVLRKSIEPDLWDEVISAKLYQMGKATPGRQGAEGDLFSVATYLTNWSRLTPEAKQAMFGGTRYIALRKQLDNLAKITAGVKDIEVMRNVSGTAQQNAYMGLVQGTGPLAGWAAGGPEGAAAGAALTVGMPYAMSKLMTNPKFVSWLAKGVEIPATNLNSMSGHLGRLVAIAQAEPEIKDEIKQFLAAFRSVQ